MGEEEHKDQVLKLICVDGSANSHKAFKWYMKNYRRDNDIIGFVHVQRMPSVPLTIGIADTAGAEMLSGYYQSIQNGKTEAQHLHDKYKRICKDEGLPCKFYTVGPHHCPGHLICELAKKKKPLCIIMGQRGLGRMSRMMLGSTSDYVLHHANVPVIVIPKTLEVNEE